MNSGKCLNLAIVSLITWLLLSLMKELLTATEEVIFYGDLSREETSAGMKSRFFEIMPSESDNG